MSQGNVIIIIPTYNEADNIPILIGRLSKLKYSFKILFVDDNSPDGTGNLIENLKQKFSFVEILHKPTKEGYGAANRAGIDWALNDGATIIGTMDADLSHQPEDLPKLLEAINNNDFVIGSRRVKGGKIIGWSWWRHFESAGATFIARFILKLKAHDITSGFRLFRTSALINLPWQQVNTTGYAWCEEILYLSEKNKLKIVEVPIVFIDRKRGKSKLGIKDIIEFFITIFRLKINK